MVQLRVVVRHCCCLGPFGSSCISSTVKRKVNARLFLDTLGVRNCDLVSGYLTIRISVNLWQRTPRSILFSGCSWANVHASAPWVGEVFNLAKLRRSVVTLLVSWRPLPPSFRIKSETFRTDKRYLIPCSWTSQESPSRTSLPMLDPAQDCICGSNIEDQALQHLKQSQLTEQVLFESHRFMWLEIQNDEYWQERNSHSSGKRAGIQSRIRTTRTSGV